MKQCVWKRLMGVALALCLLIGTAAIAEDSGYQLGDKVDDFSLTLADGTEVSLYGLLAEKKVVVLNF